MRKIDKGDSPAWLDAWKLSFENNNGRKPGYDDFSDAGLKMRLRNDLVTEQGAICCYCMRRISPNKSIIEHFKPRALRLDDELDYSNLFASCSGQENELSLSLVHCDKRKENWFDERFPLLTSADVEKVLHYRINGEVEPYHNSNHPMHSVELSIINHLGLNAPFLVRNRKNAYDVSELMDDDIEYDKEDWEDLIKFYDSKHNNKYEEYCMAFIDLILSNCV